MDEQIAKLWLHVYSRILFLQSPPICDDMNEGIMVSEVSETEKYKHYPCLPLRGILGPGHTPR